MSPYRQSDVEASILDDEARRLWCSVAIAVAQSSNSQNSSACITWADAVLAAYTARFRNGGSR